LWLAFFSVADALNVLLYFAAMQKTTVAIAVLTHYLAPVFVALASPRILGEPRVRGIWTAVGLALVGLSLLLEPHKADGDTSLIGAGFGAASAVLFAGAMLSIKRLGTWFSSTQILVWHYPGALLILFLAIPAGELIALNWKVLGILCLCGLVPGALGGLLFVEGIRRLPASRAGVLTLIEPLVAVMMGIFVWGESPGIVAFVGGSVVLFAAYRVVTSTAVDEKS
jgi:drug/metabolite transporter (DMT)-like permease